jgi:hypothetical protein
MNSHEVWFMLNGLQEYVHRIKTDKFETPDYKLLMIGTARIACEKLEKWAIKHDWHSVTNLSWIKDLKDELAKERVKQDKAWEKLNKKLKLEREERKT